MTDNEFWKIIETAKKRGAGDLDKQLRAVRELLEALPAPEIAEFDRIFDGYRREAYRWDLWAAAYIINGGCSDDGFEYFRAWLIALGERVYQNALKDPESLADVPEASHEPPEFESLMYVAREVYLAKTGEDLPRSGVAFPREPAGVRWAEGDEAELDPKLAKKFGLT